MLFNSPEYLVFFLAILAASWALRRQTSLRIWLQLLASYYFYASNNHWLIVLILISTQIDFMVAKAIEDSSDPVRRRRLLWVSMVGNLALLGFFKYFNFCVSSAIEVVRLFGHEVEWTPWQIILPVGISFYTFQSMSYTLDVYFGAIPAERSWSRFAFYVAFFPQLVAGPIMRAREFMPQIGLAPRLDAPAAERALALIARGLLKKMVIADYFLAPFADAAFDHPELASTFSAWLGLYAFTFQIYFDFSGYSDIAIGCSRLLAFELPDNFNLPYVAISFSDFWQRWHISLSSWLRDYLYIPLGGNRMPTQAGVYRNLLLTMILGGLWHGAAWHFVLWGTLHGLYLAVERWVGGPRHAGEVAHETAGKRLFRRVLVFQAVVLTWLLFRAQDTAHLVGMTKSLAGFSDAPLVLTGGMLMCAVVVLVSYLLQFLSLGREVTDRFLTLPLPVRGLSYSVLVLLVLTFNKGAQPFIYFAF